MKRIIKFSMKSSFVSAKYTHIQNITIRMFFFVVLYGCVQINRFGIYNSIYRTHEDVGWLLISYFALQAQQLKSFHVTMSIANSILYSMKRQGCILGKFASCSHLKQFLKNQFKDIHWIQLLDNSLSTKKYFCNVDIICSSQNWRDKCLITELSHLSKLYSTSKIKIQFQ